MRLWSLHPIHLDGKGLVALWREGLGALATLKKKKGYYNHPQLERFKNTENPVLYLKAYMEIIYEESVRRKYRFNKSLLGIEKEIKGIKPLEVSKGQINFELDHLKKKLKVRDRCQFNELDIFCEEPMIHPLFIINILNTKKEKWEKG